MTQDTNTDSVAAIKRYKIGYHTDEWGARSSTPGGITDPSGQWVLYKDHIAALASAAAPPDPSAAQAVNVREEIWTCKIGGKVTGMPSGADSPMRRAVFDTFARMTGYEPEFCFSGWGGKLTEPERAVVEDRPPSAEYEAEWLAQNTAPQPSPVAQGDALDAARYHYLRDVPMERWPAELLTAIRLQQNTKWDAAIDAARAAQEGKV